MRKQIFGGRSSKQMWRDINKAKTVEDLRHALYGVGCKCQELEARVNELEDELRKAKR